MNLSETADLLTAMSAFDRRTIGDGDVIAWQSVLSDVSFGDCLEAVKRHHAEHTEWMMPAHVRRLVRDIVREREALASATGWAPGQAGVPKDQAMPEIAGPIAEGELTPSVRALLDSVRAMLPEGSREALMPRRVAWEREHRAFVRTRDGQPNPLYAHAHPAVKVRGCDWHEEGGYGFKWDCRTCNPGHPAYRQTGDEAVAEACCSDPTCRCEPGECACGPRSGQCDLCGAKSGDLAQHVADYPNGSCA